MAKPTKIRDLIYTDNVLRPAEALTLKFKGPDVVKIFGMAKPVLMTLLEIDSPKFYEDMVMWDVSSGSFRGLWKGVKPYDRWTKLFYVLNCFGKYNSKTKQGDITIKLRPYLYTRVEYANEFQKALWWVYSFLFYNAQRRQYLRRSLDFHKQIEDTIKAAFGIPTEFAPGVEKRPEAAGAEAAPA